MEMCHRRVRTNEEADEAVWHHWPRGLWVNRATTATGKRNRRGGELQRGQRKWLFKTQSKQPQKQSINCRTNNYCQWFDWIYWRFVSGQTVSQREYWGSFPVPTVELSHRWKQDLAADESNCLQNPTKTFFCPRTLFLLRNSWQTPVPEGICCPDIYMMLRLWWWGTGHGKVATGSPIINQLPL